MARISAEIERVLLLLALRLVAEHLDKNVPGASGFAEHFACNQSPAEQEINAAFDAHVRRIYRETCADIKREQAADRARACASKVTELNG